MNELQFPELCASIALRIDLAFAVKDGIPADRAMPALWREAVSESWPPPPAARSMRSCGSATVPKPRWATSRPSA